MKILFCIWGLALSLHAIQSDDPLLCPCALVGFEKLVTQEQIAERITLAAQEIDRDFNGEDITVVVVMKGALFLASDLIRKLNSPCTVETVRASSYGMHGTTSGELTIRGLDRLDLAGKNVLLIDDIFDTGKTLSTIAAKIEEMEPQTLRSLVLLLKNVPHSTDYRPDYALFEIENRFVIGYGLDYKEYWRNLPEIYAVE